MVDVCGYISAEEERINATLYQSSMALSFLIDGFHATLRSTLYSWGISDRQESASFRHVASPFSRFWYFERNGGEIFFEDTGETIVMKPGQRYIVSPGHPFVVTYYPNSLLYYAHFSVLDWTGQRLFRHAAPLYMPEGPADEKFVKEAWERRCASAALPLLVHIAACYLTGNWADLRTEYEFCAKFKNVFEYMESAKPASLRVGVMAQKMNMTQAAFSRSFHSVMGVTPKDFLTRYYLETAIDLLCGSDISIAETARRLGHTNVPNFFHTFKRLTGISPADYRKKV